jgi:glycosyltransferase involved in cell wall biosynthesis
MRICFYAPFKPLNHPNPSGDQIIAKGLYTFLTERGHSILIASDFRSRWIFWKPWLLPKLIKEFLAASRKIRDFKPDLFLTYHSYYKSPDLLGPSLCRKFHIPYILFQGIYSTKQRRSLKGRPGFYLNRRCLLQAAHLFTNRRVDHKNLLRLIPQEKLSYVRPGIFPEMFPYDADARQHIRKEYQTEDCPLLISAAMFRDDVKTEGLTWMLKTLAKIDSIAFPFKLIIAGDGSERKPLEQLAEKLLPGRCFFAGKVARKEMYMLYSAGDIFVFPGIRESLGMVYLEAQSCGLPVIAFDNGGIPEVVQKDISGFLTKPFAEQEFIAAVQSLLADETRRKSMGNAGAVNIRKIHDLHSNYLQFEETLLRYASLAKS